MLQDFNTQRFFAFQRSVSLRSSLTVKDSDFAKRYRLLPTPTKHRPSKVWSLSFNLSACCNMSCVVSYISIIHPESSPSFIPGHLLNCMLTGPKGKCRFANFPYSKDKRQNLTRLGS